MLIRFDCRTHSYNDLFLIVFWKSYCVLLDTLLCSGTLDHVFGIFVKWPGYVFILFTSPGTKPTTQQKTGVSTHCFWVSVKLCNRWPPLWCFPLSHIKIISRIFSNQKLITMWPIILSHNFTLCQTGMYHGAVLQYTTFWLATQI